MRTLGFAVRAMTALARTQMLVATPQSSISSYPLNSDRSAEHPNVSFSSTLHLPEYSATEPWSLQPSVPLMQCGTGSILPSSVVR